MGTPSQKRALKIIASASSSAEWRASRFSGWTPTAG